MIVLRCGVSINSNELIHAMNIHVEFSVSVLRYFKSCLIWIHWNELKHHKELLNIGLALFFFVMWLLDVYIKQSNS